MLSSRISRAVIILVVLAIGFFRFLSFRIGPGLNQRPSDRNIGCEGRWRKGKQSRKEWSIPEAELPSALALFSRDTHHNSPLS